MDFTLHCLNMRVLSQTKLSDLEEKAAQVLNDYQDAQVCRIHLERVDCETH